MRQLFIDLDGVLADMDGFYETHFGVRLNRQMKDSDVPDLWPNIKSFGRFYFDMPMMSDAMDLWRGANALHPRPAILTGVSHSYPEAEHDKRAWVAKHLGPDVPVFTSLSKDKRTHGKPGDILVDDWFRYQHLWEEMGGIFILHTSAADSLERLKAYL